MQRNFHSTIDPELRPKENRSTGPTDASSASYGQTVVGRKGAEVCGPTGRSRHLTLTEAGSEASVPIAPEGLMILGPWVLELTAFAVLQGMLGPEYRQNGDRLR